MRALPALPAALLAALLLAGCGPAATVTGTADDKPAAEQAKPAKKKEPAKIGDTITLHGTDSKLKVAVKLAKVIPTAKSSTGFIKAGNGKRFYAVELALKNTGKTVYDDAPMNGAAIVDSTGQQYTPTIVDLQGGASLEGTITISSGDLRRGLIGFEVPTKAKIVKLQFALDSGMADQKGEWLTHR